MVTPDEIVKHCRSLCSSEFVCIDLVLIELISVRDDAFCLYEFETIYYDLRLNVFVDIGCPFFFSSKSYDLRCKYILPWWSYSHDELFVVRHVEDA